MSDPDNFEEIYASEVSPHKKEPPHDPHHVRYVKAIIPEFSDYVMLFYFISGINMFAFFMSLPVTDAVKPGGWYEDIHKSFMTPPDTWFAPVWTVLYTLTALAAWKVWLRRERYNVVFPLILFTVQLIVNYAWTPIFFGMREFLYALIDLAVLIVLVAWNTRMFINIDKTAGALMMPYFMWLFYALYLNAYIVLNN